MHDIERPGEGNIEHVGSGPGGVFLVETKLRSYKDDQLVEAKRQAARLHDELGVPAAAWTARRTKLHLPDRRSRARCSRSGA
jgi:hypothetical protein